MNTFRLRLLAASCIIILLSIAAGSIKANAPLIKADFKATTVFLVRHAEKAAEPRQDPPLLESGNTRAQELARILEPVGIKAIYTSQFLRTRQTAEPLAKHLGITATVLEIKMNPAKPKEISEQSYKDIVEKIYEHPGDAALVVGHSNTVPEVIKMLGGDVAPIIDEKNFDDLFVVTVYAKGKAKVAHLKYGNH
ncbi:MAG TPA: phosphoglycerate mutase family protein [Blastocatellia bacterium]|jgi:phosphohistidine phosphatase SixA|nr:phosphoglycerate mutase family protein [Blastocatellia bacterium]